jgi:chemotaxis family two-component system response regulator Rcp1
MRNILLVDDSENDRILLTEALRGADPELQVHQVCDGEECLDFLRKQGEYAAAVSPDLVLLDLHLRRMDGSEVLAELQADLALRHIPVVVLSTSASRNEITMVYQRGCRAYMVKPASFHEMRRRLSVLITYWSEIAERPPHALARLSV